MRWHVSSRFDRRALRLADKHYTRQKIGTPQFVAPGRCLVLLTENADALWTTSWPEFAQHKWRGAWICALFRNESPILSSELIVEAVAATRAVFGDPPELGFITFVDPSAVKRKRDPGRCFIRAGWRRCGLTAKGLLVFELLPDKMPAPDLPIGFTADLGLALI
jgi:hypothetical protein